MNILVMISEFSSCVVFDLVFVFAGLELQVTSLTMVICCCFG